ncbi:MAG: acyl-CoA thioesterase [Polyangiales bacterium]
MFSFRRPVHFEEIDAAGYVYFPRLVALAHEGIERLFQQEVPGGYAAFVVGKRVGLPCVHVSADFSAPLRFGDEITVILSVRKIGTSSVAFDVKVERQDGVLCATIDYVCACTDLDGPKARPLPVELRAVLEIHAS